MKLELGNFRVKEMVFGSKTRLVGGRLELDLDALRSLVVEDDHFSNVAFHIARPGESVRIIHALDVIQPRYKVSGPGCVFPGFLGPPVTVGQGRTHQLQGMAVVTAGPPVIGEMAYMREAIIDMSGPGAPYSPFSQTLNLVVELTSPESVGLSEADGTDSLQGSEYSRRYNLAVRVAGFKIASYLAEGTRDSEPETIEVLELPPADPDLPRIAYVPQFRMSEHLYGKVLGWQPTLLHPNELMDGVLFSTVNNNAGMRNPSYFYLNNPVVGALYRSHGKEINFLGIVLSREESETMDDKERTTSYAANLLSMMEADGAILTFGGAGQPSVDVMLLCGKCERLGIKTTLLYPEMARTPDDPGFSDFVAEADSIVSTGNYEREVILPPMDRVVGGTHLLGSGLDASSILRIPIRLIYASANPLGASKLTGVQF